VAVEFTRGVIAPLPETADVRAVSPEVAAVPTSLEDEPLKLALGVTLAGAVTVRFVGEAEMAPDAPLLEITAVSWIVEKVPVPEGSELLALGVAAIPRVTVSEMFAEGRGISPED
jgi:hypothetical protein